MLSLCGTRCGAVLQAQQLVWGSGKVHLPELAILHLYAITLFSCTSLSLLGNWARLVLVAFETVVVATFPFPWHTLKFSSVACLVLQIPTGFKHPDFSNLRWSWGLLSAGTDHRRREQDGARSARQRCTHLCNRAAGARGMGGGADATLWRGG